MTTRREVRRLRKARCKTLKNSPFFKRIIAEWKRQTHNGSIHMDVGRNYTCDYYLGESVKEDHWNHVHLIRDIRFPKRLSRIKSSGYCFKKKVGGRVIHSKVHLIDKRDEPRNIVDEMLAKYDVFIRRVR